MVIVGERVSSSQERQNTRAFASCTYAQHEARPHVCWRFGVTTRHGEHPTIDCAAECARCSTCSYPPASQRPRRCAGLPSAKAASCKRTSCCATGSRRALSSSGAAPPPVCAAFRTGTRCTQVARDVMEEASVDWLTLIHFSSRHRYVLVELEVDADEPEFCTALELGRSLCCALSRPSSVGIAGSSESCTRGSAVM